MLGLSQYKSKIQLRIYYVVLSFCYFRLTTYHIKIIDDILNFLECFETYVYN